VIALTLDSSEALVDSKTKFNWFDAAGLYQRDESLGCDTFNPQGTLLNGIDLAWLYVHMIC